MVNLVQIRKIMDTKDLKHFGGTVPNGGSNCAKCSFLADNKTDCRNKKFQAWQKAMGSKTPNVIPGKIDEYCCNFFPVTAPKKKGPSTSEMLGLK